VSDCKLFCKQCRSFVGFIRDNRLPLPNSCPLPDADTWRCDMQPYLASHAPRPKSEWFVSKSKLAAGLTPRQAAKHGVT